MKTMDIRIETENGIHFTIWYKEGGDEHYYCNLNKHGVSEKIKELIQRKLEG